MQSSPEPLNFASETDALRRLVSSLVEGSAAAEDIVQDTWLTTLEGQGRPGGVRGWLRGVAKRKAHDWRRTEARRVARERRAAETRQAAAQRESESVRERQPDLIQEVLATVGSLPQDQRRALVARFLSGEMPRVIADREGVAVATVESRIQRGLRAVRSKLDARHGSRELWALPLLLSCAAMARASTRAGSLIAIGASVLIAFIAWGLFERDPVRDSQPPSQGGQRASVQVKPSGDEPQVAGLPSIPFPGEADTPPQPDRPAQPENTIVGRVLQPGRFPLADSAVELLRDGAVIGSTRTDAQGRFRLRCNDDGRIRTRVTVRVVQPGAIAFREVVLHRPGQRNRDAGDLFLEPGAKLRLPGDRFAGLRVLLIALQGAMGETGARLETRVVPATGLVIDPVPARDLLVLTANDPRRTGSWVIQASAGEELHLDQPFGPQRTLPISGQTFCAPSTAVEARALVLGRHGRRSAVFDPLLLAPGADQAALHLPADLHVAAMNWWTPDGRRGSINRNPHDDWPVLHIDRFAPRFEYRVAPAASPREWVAIEPQSARANQAALTNYWARTEEGVLGLADWPAKATAVRLRWLDQRSVLLARPQAEGWQGAVDPQPPTEASIALVDPEGQPIAGREVTLKTGPYFARERMRSRSDAAGRCRLKSSKGEVVSVVLDNGRTLHLGPLDEMQEARFTIRPAQLHVLQLHNAGSPALPDHFALTCFDGRLEVLEEDPEQGRIHLRWLGASTTAHPRVLLTANGSTDRKVRTASPPGEPWTSDWNPRESLVFRVLPPPDGSHYLVLERKPPDQPFWVTVRSGDGDARPSGRVSFQDLAPGEYRLRDESTGLFSLSIVHPQTTPSLQPELDLSRSGSLRIEFTGVDWASLHPREWLLSSSGPFVAGGQLSWSATRPGVLTLRHAGQGPQSLSLADTPIETVDGQPIRLMAPGDELRVPVQLRGAPQLSLFPTLEDNTSVRAFMADLASPPWSRTLRIRSGRLTLSGLPSGNHRIALLPPAHPLILLSTSDFGREPHPIRLEPASSLDLELEGAAAPLGSRWLATATFNSPIKWTRRAEATSEGVLRFRGLRSGPAELFLRRLNPPGLPDRTRTLTFSRGLNRITWKIEP